MLRKIIVGAISVGTMVLSATSANAAVVTNVLKSREMEPYLIFGETTTDQNYQVSWGVDNNPNSVLSSSAPFSTPYTDITQSNFLASLTNPTTQTFNNLPAETVTTLPLNFGSAGTATFQGSGTLVTDATYPYAKSNSEFLTIGNRTAPVNVPGTSFNEIDFSKPIGALGFYLNIPENYPYSSTNLELTAIDGSIQTIGLTDRAGDPNKSGTAYFDITAQNLSREFTKIKFVGQNSRIEGFGLENITATSFDQIKQSTPVPEPTSILGSVGAIAFGVVLRRKFKK